MASNVAGLDPSTKAAHKLEISIFGLNFAHYWRPDGGFDKYRSQPLEKHARLLARRVVATLVKHVRPVGVATSARG